MNWKPIAIFVVAAVAGMLLSSNGPIGSQIWPVAEGTPDPEGSTLMLLMIAGGVEAAAFGLGVCWLVYGRNAARMLGGAGGLGVGLYLSVAWLLVNWVPHTSLHMNHGNIVVPSDYTGLVAIEYGFHVTLVLAGACIAWCLYRVGRGTPVAKTVATPGKARAT